MIPRGIFGLTSLTRLCLPLWRRGCAIKMEDLTNLSNMRELSITVKAYTMSNCRCMWLEMRKLSLVYEYADGDKDDGVDILPFNTESMHNLRCLRLVNYGGLSLPHYCGKFQNLEMLSLVNCHKLRDLGDNARDSFPKLNRLGLSGLESFARLNEATMPKLEYVGIMRCPMLRRPMENLDNLRGIYGDKDGWLNIIRDDEGKRVKFENLYKGWLFFW